MICQIQKLGNQTTAVVVSTTMNHRNRLLALTITAAALFASACGSSSTDALNPVDPPQNSTEETSGDRQLPGDNPTVTDWIYTPDASGDADGYAHAPILGITKADNDQAITISFEMPTPAPCTEARARAIFGEAIGIDLEFRSVPDTGCAQVISPAELTISLPEPINNRPIEY